MAKPILQVAQTRVEAAEREVATAKQDLVVVLQAFIVVVKRLQQLPMEEVYANPILQVAQARVEAAERELAAAKYDLAVLEHLQQAWMKAVEEFHPSSFSGCDKDRELCEPAVVSNVAPTFRPEVSDDSTFESQPQNRANEMMAIDLLVHDENTADLLLGMI